MNYNQFCEGKKNGIRDTSYGSTTNKCCRPNNIFHSKKKSFNHINTINTLDLKWCRNSHTRDLLSMKRKNISTTNQFKIYLNKKVRTVVQNIANDVHRMYHLSKLSTTK